MALDIDRVAASALRTYLESERNEGHGPAHKRRNRRLGGIGAVALGVGLAVAARAAYGRFRELDLEQAAGAIEKKLRD